MATSLSGVAASNSLIAWGENLNGLVEADFDEEENGRATSSQQTTDSHHVHKIPLSLNLPGPIVRKYGEARAIVRIASTSTCFPGNKAKATVITDITGGILHFPAVIIDKEPDKPRQTNIDASLFAKNECRCHNTFQVDPSLVKSVVLNFVAIDDDTVEAKLYIESNPKREQTQHLKEKPLKLLGRWSSLSKLVPAILTGRRRHLSADTSNTIEES